MRKMNTITRATAIAGLTLGLLAGCSGGSGSDGAATTAATATEASSTGSSSAAVVAPDQIYTSTDGKYSVDFPATPSITNETQAMLGTQVDMEFASLDFDGDRYMVVSTDVGALVEDAPETMDAMLDGVVTGFISSSGGEQTELETIEFEGRPARRFEFNAESGGQALTGIGLVVGDGSIVYQVAVFGANADKHAPFIDSFHLNEAASG